jgi:prevent-host-death family protein
MIVATITELKNKLSAYIDRVRAGESILVLDRGVPVARLEPAAAGDDPSGRLDRLARAGLLRPGPGKGVRELLDREPPKTRSGASVVDALLEERRRGR